jgi:hypothetical protein
VDRRQAELHMSRMYAAAQLRVFRVLLAYGYATMLIFARGEVDRSIRGA